MLVKSNVGNNIAGVGRLDFDRLVLLRQVSDVDFLVDYHASACLAIGDKVGGLVPPELNLGVFVELDLGACVAKHLLGILRSNRSLVEIAGGIAEEVYSVGFGVGVQPSDDTPFTVSHGGLIIGKKRHTPHFGHNVLSICGGGRYVATVVAFVAVVIVVVVVGLLAGRANNIPRSVYF